MGIHTCLGRRWRSIALDDRYIRVPRCQRPESGLSNRRLAWTLWGGWFEENKREGKRRDGRMASVRERIESVGTKVSVVEVG